MDFNYELDGEIDVFCHTLTGNNPYFSKGKRNHESIFIVTDGNLIYEKGSEKTIIKKGEVGYIARGSVDKSGTYLGKSVSYIAVNFGFSSKDLFPSLPFKTLCSSGFSYDYESPFKELFRLFTLKIPGYKLICKGILMQIIGLLFTEYASDGLLFKGVQRISAALDHLRLNYSSTDLTVRELARISNMSERQFRRIFLEVYNKAPYAFILDFRINEAKRQLLNSEKSVSEIALECGFSDLYSFSHSFKSHTGLTPMKYRNRE
jgi:AraC-like DNA-binding protein